MTLAAASDSNREVVIALLSAFAGFALAFLYDLVKAFRAERERERLVLTLLETELVEASDVLKVIQAKLLNEEPLPDIHLREPLPVPESELVEILRLGIPRPLLQDHQLGQRCRASHRKVRH